MPELWSRRDLGTGVAVWSVAKDLVADKNLFEV